MIDFNFGTRLDSIKESDVELLRSYRNDRRINEWCRQTGLISEENQKKWFSKLDDSNHRMFTVKGMLEDTVVGVCGLTSLDWQASRAEFSLYIAANHQGRGYGKKALMTLLKHGFWDLGLNLIYGETFEGNKAFEMFLSLGMMFEGTRRQFYFKNGRFIDAHLVSITQMEFLEAKWNKL